MKATLLYSAAVAAAIGCEALAIDVTSSSLSVSFDEQVKGAVARVVAVRGQELGAIKSHAPLFSLSLCRADSYTNIAYVSSADATTFSAERLADGARLVYAFAEGPPATPRSAGASRRPRETDGPSPIPATRAFLSQRSSAHQVRTTPASSASPRAASSATPAPTSPDGQRADANPATSWPSSPAYTTIEAASTWPPRTRRATRSTFP